MNQPSNFQQMMQQMENNIADESNAFAVDTTNQHRIHLTNPEALLHYTPSARETAMLNRIKRVDDYSWSRGKNGGLDTGFTEFNEAIDGGIQSGFILFGANPNVGKSAFMLQLMKNISERNENVYCEYHSKDDSVYELMPRWIACDQRITIGQAKSPERYQDNTDAMERRNEGLKNLYRNARRFNLMDSEEIPETIEDLENHIKDLKMELPENTKIVIGIDSFYDLRTTENFGSNHQKEIGHIAKTIKQYAQTYDITFMCTAHLRKTGTKRPINDDLKENNVIEYEANLLCLLYNEVGIKEQAADIYWESEDEELKMPVLEMRFSKNKYSDFKRTLFYHFVPSQSYFMETDKEATNRYASLVYQN